MNYYMNGKLVLLNTGEALMVNSRQMHYGYSENGQDCYFIRILDVYKRQGPHHRYAAEGTGASLLPCFLTKPGLYARDVYKRQDLVHCLRYVRILLRFRSTNSIYFSLFPQ